jgi:hypothetical protein
MMKKFLLLLVLFLMVAISPMWVSAAIIGDVNIKVAQSSPLGNLTIYGSLLHSVFLDYDVSINSAKYVEAFCVEDAISDPGNSIPYTLLTIDNGLSDFNLNPTTYEKAAWVASYYGSHVGSYATIADKDNFKAAAQLVVWESVFDTTFDFSNGNFKITNVDNTILSEANAIGSQFPGNFGPSNNWLLAVNPTVEEGDSITVKRYQNYLVPVPEPTILILLGVSLLGLVGVRRFSK